MPQPMSTEILHVKAAARLLGDTLSPRRCLFGDGKQQVPVEQRPADWRERMHPKDFEPEREQAPRGIHRRPRPARWSQAGGWPSPDHAAGDQVSVPKPGAGTGKTSGSDYVSVGGSH